MNHVLFILSDQQVEQTGTGEMIKQASLGRLCQQAAAERASSIHVGRAITCVSHGSDIDHLHNSNINRFGCCLAHVVQVERRGCEFGSVSSWGESDMALCYSIWSMDPWPQGP